MSERQRCCLIFDHPQYALISVCNFLFKINREYPWDPSVLLSLGIVLVNENNVNVQYSTDFKK